MKFNLSRVGVLTALLLASGSVWAVDAPPCLGPKGPLPIDNDTVLKWKDTTENQFFDRAHISGQIVSYPDLDQGEQPVYTVNGHDHFVIQIGKDPDDVIEVIYNTDFGALPDLKAGMTVEACGVYITATAQSGPYPPSPVGALIHWVHQSPNLHKHESGFLMINNQLYGNHPEHAPPRPPRKRHRHHPDDPQPDNLFGVW